MTGSPWAVVLAGGDGERVSALTRDARGHVVPKQYWSCGNRGPMVRWALARARRVAPDPHVLVVVNEAHRSFWEPQLADLPRGNLLRQPGNRGTAVGVLLALAAVRARGGGGAPVALLPSDHYVADEAVLHRALAEAVLTARHDRRAVLLLGMAPADASAGYGWILPATEHPIAPVARFVEKPPLEDVGALVGRGALVNSFLVVARAQTLLDIIDAAIPGVCRLFRRAGAAEADGPDIRRLYRELPPLDLSRHVLEREAARLTVIRVPPCGWSDLGTPERLRQFLSAAAPPAPAPHRREAAA